MAKNKNFLIGAATAAHQVEGNNKYSDYWVIEQMKSTSFAEPSLDAVDHYNRYEEDIRLMAQAGLNAYRFSIEWARIEPRQGEFDEKEIAHYRKVLECCQTNGIEPIVTMHHFTSPKWLIEKGGWESEETIQLFARYCRYVAGELGDLMHYVCTINEANMGFQISAISERYIRQMKSASGKGQTNSPLKKQDGNVQVGINMESMMQRMEQQKRENMELFGVEAPQIFVSARTIEGDQIVMKAHQAAKAAIKEVKPEIQVGITLSLHDIQSIQGGEKEAAAEWEREFTHYLPYMIDDDFFGLQNYTRSVYGADGIQSSPEGTELTQMDYEYYPQALEHVIRRVYSELPIPIIITENGIATEDDSRRIAFIQEAVSGVEKCRHDGIPVLGYLYWSLLDNFEWQKGYSMMFGLIRVDRKTQKRMPKRSLKFLGELANKEN